MGKGKRYFLIYATISLLLIACLTFTTFNFKLSFARVHNEKTALNKQNKEANEKIKNLQSILNDVYGKNKQLTDTNIQLKDENEKLKSLMPDKWLTFKTPYYTIHYVVGYDGDQNIIDSYLSNGIEDMQKEFPELNVKDFLKHSTLDVYLEPRPNNDEGLYHFRTYSWKKEHKYMIYLLTPSARKVELKKRNEENDPFKNYVQRGVMHEFSTIFIEQLNINAGWDIYKGPSWVGDGYQEYYGMIYSGNKDLELKNRIIKQRYNRTINLVGNQFTFNIPEDDGSVIMAFFYDTYGKQKMHNVLMSKEHTFEKAVEKECDSWENIKIKFNKWLDENSY